MDQVCIVFTDGTSALMLAAENNSLEVAKLLVSYECCLQSKTGLTALMYAARRGHADLVSLLLNHESMMVDSRGYGTYARYRPGSPRVHPNPCKSRNKL